MSEWKDVKLGDFFIVKHGFSFKGKSITSEKKLTILVTSGYFHLGGELKFHLEKYTDRVKGLKESPHKV